jgi:hypothetical protein
LVFLGQSRNWKDGFSVQGADQKSWALFEKEIPDSALLLSIQKIPPPGQKKQLNALLSFNGVYFRDRNFRAAHVRVVGLGPGILPGDQEADFHRFGMGRRGKKNGREKEGQAKDSLKKRPLSRDDKKAAVIRKGKLPGVADQAIDGDLIFLLLRRKNKEFGLTRESEFGPPTR